jgi:hypothetical protein
MRYRAIHVDEDPINYFLDKSGENQFLRVSDVVLRENKDPREVFALAIRIATGSKWSHSAVVYLTRDPYHGFNNTFLVEAITKGIRIQSWRDEVVPFEQFTVGIKRPRLDWYTETPYEAARHDPRDLEDVHGISYLRHVRGIALDQLNGFYDHKTVYEMTALFAQRAAKQHLQSVPRVADAAAAVANFFKKWDESDSSTSQMLSFMCSGLVQYSFFEALHRRIMNDFDIPSHRAAAASNLRNMQHVIFREDPEGIISNYIRQIQSGELDIHRPAPPDVLDFLKTTTPADFNNSPYLEWRYVILKGVVWQIEEAPEDYTPASQDEQDIISMLHTDDGAISTS